MGDGIDPELNPYAAPQAELTPRESVDTGSGFIGYATFGQRFVAVLIDQLLMGVIGFAIGLTSAFIMIGIKMNPNQPGAQVFNFVLGLLLGLGYYGGMTSSSTQATLGKMAMGLKVTDLQGRRISFGRAVGRELAKFVSGLTFLIGYIMVAFTEKKQGLHDMIAGTLVLKQR